MIIISDCLTETADEGTIKIASKIAKLLQEQGAKVFQLNEQTSYCDRHFAVGRTGVSLSLVKAIIKEGEDILYIPNASMTISICVRVFLFSILSSKKVYLLPVYRRKISKLMRLLFSLSKCEFIVLSQESLDAYESVLQNKIHYVKAGVDTDKFNAVSAELKTQLRKKYNLDIEKKIVLHVGHMVEARNLRAYLKVNDDKQIVIVVSTSTRWDNDLYEELMKKKNILIVHEYIHNIEEYYQLADAYVFMVENTGCVDVPLSVLEAAACNIPIVTTEYGELKALEKVRSIVFVKPYDDINVALDSVLEISSESINNRDIVKQYDWKKSVECINRIVKG